MKIITEPFDHEEQDRALVAALTRTDHTRIYLDTSALVWLYRIRRQARGEFVDFLETAPIKERSHIPLWSLHELNKHRRTKTALFPLSEQHGVLTNAIQNVVTNAHLFVDDRFASSTRWGSGVAFIEALTARAKALDEVLAPLRTTGQVNEIDIELQDFLQSHALQQPLPPLAALREEFIARCEGRLPPGYEDAGKGGREAAVSNYAGANRFGDYVFWRSVVDHASSDDTVRTVVIISHDAKPDWVHRPDTIVGYGQRKSQTKKKNGVRETKVTCPQPVLSFEIWVEARVERLFIVSIEQLVLAFSLTGAGGGFRELARAIQIESDTSGGEAATESEAETQADADAQADAAVGEPGGGIAVGGEDGVAGEVVGAAEDGGDAIAPVPGIEVAGDALTARLEALGPEALADAAFVSDPDGAPEADEVVVALKSYNWYVQNPAVLELRKRMGDPRVSDTQLFVLGRNLYQSACGSAFRASDMLSNLDTLAASGDPEPVRMLFAGCLFEAYFNSEGMVRRRPKHEMIDALFDLGERAPFASAVAWLRARLANVVHKYVLLPGDARKTATFAWQQGAAKVAEIRVHGVCVTEPIEPDADGWDPRALPARAGIDTLTGEIASEFAIPEDSIMIQPAIEETIGLAHLRFTAWGPHSDLDFPVA